MNAELAQRRSAPPLWAVAVVLGHTTLVGLALLLAQRLAQSDLILCPFRNLTGLPCAGCGTLRMILAALQGNLLEALALNPLMFVLFVGGLLYGGARLLRVPPMASKPSRRTTYYLLAALVLAVALNWAYLVLSTDQ